MKSPTQITFSKAWWKKEAPDGLKKSGPAFEKAVAEYEKAAGGLGGAKAEAAAKAVEKALDQIVSAAKAVSAEAKDLEKKEKDKKRKADLANTVAVMGKPLQKELDAARAAVAAAEGAGGGAKELTDPVEHAKYIRDWARRIKTGEVSFALGLPSNDPAAMRFHFHRTKAPRGLVGALKKEVGAKKWTWGKVGSQAMAEGLGVGDAGARTLVIDLHGRVIPALGRRVKVMMKQLGVSQFSKVKIIKEGRELEGADEAVPDDAPLEEIDLATPDPDDDIVEDETELSDDDPEQAGEDAAADENAGTGADAGANPGASDGAGSGARAGPPSHPSPDEIAALEKIWERALRDVARDVEALRGELLKHLDPAHRAVREGLAGVMDKFPDLDLGALADAAGRGEAAYQGALRQTEREMADCRRLLENGPILKEIDKNPYTRTSVHKTVRAALSEIGDRLGV